MKAGGARRSGREGGGAGPVGRGMGDWELGWAAWASRQAKAGGVGGPAGLEKKRKEKGNPFEIDFSI
jgi:hypothetical protein